MFTGLIQSFGSLRSQGSQQLLVHCRSVQLVSGLSVGDSVAVDGICLTVETVTESGFIVTTSPETLDRTTLWQKVDTDWPANLEPALRVGDRLGGHFVTGHVDGLGLLKHAQQTAESWEMAFEVPLDLGRAIVSKGSVAINGVSLTVADCTADGTEFTVAVIPHSFAQTNLNHLTPNAAVNVETDVLGKYVAKFLRLPAPAQAWPTALSEESISAEFLAEHGFV